MSNVEFSSVEITKALYGGIRGASEILGKSEQDFIHSALALAVGKVIRENFETVHLDGESVEADVESLRGYYSLKREGKYVRLSIGGNLWHLKNVSKAMELVEEEVERETFEQDEDFRLFFRNISHEGACNPLRDKLIQDLLDEGKSYEEAELVVEERQADYRINKGYLASEVPVGFVPRTYQSLIDPYLFLSGVDLAASLAQIIDAEDFTIREVVLFVVTFKQLGRKSKQRLEDFLGKKRMDRIKRLIALKVKTYIVNELDGVLDMLEVEETKDDGEDEEETD